MRTIRSRLCWHGAGVRGKQQKCSWEECQLKRMRVPSRKVMSSDIESMCETIGTTERRISTAQEEKFWTYGHFECHSADQVCPSNLRLDSWSNPLLSATFERGAQVDGVSIERYTKGERWILITVHFTILNEMDYGEREFRSRRRIELARARQRMERCWMKRVQSRNEYAYNRCYHDAWWIVDSRVFRRQILNQSLCDMAYH